MKIKICEENRGKLDSVERSAQKGASARIITCDDIFWLAKEAEKALADLKICQKARKGAKYYYSEGSLQGVARAYKYSRQSSVAIIERGSSGWHLIEIKRASFYPNERDRSGLILAERQQAVLKARAENERLKNAPLPPGAVLVTAKMLAGIPLPSNI